MRVIVQRAARPATATLEPGALEARRLRFLRPEGRSFHPAKSAPALAAAGVDRLAEEADWP